jgi:flagellar biosynthetic protein FlhB
VAGDKHDKTEAPTPKRKKEARKEGRVVRSEDLVTWILILISTSVLPGLVGRTTALMQRLMQSMVVMAGHPDANALPGLVGRALADTLTTLVPSLLALAAVAVAGNVAQVGLLLSPGPLKPKLSHLNPISGFKRIFSIKGLWSTATSVMKLGIILTVAFVLLRGMETDLVNAPPRSAEQSVLDIGAMTLQVVRMVAAAALVIALADWSFQRWQHAKSMKMSKHEIKQEHRESDGDPHVKSRQRSLRFAMTRNRMLAAVAEADVVLTNPTHFAVAIRYQPTKGAPRVVARGADGLAARIRSAATLAQVPVVESKPLARALYGLCRVNEEIPSELYQGVATVLAFIHRLGPASRSYGGRLALPVPDSWTPSRGELVRIPPARRRFEARQAAAREVVGAPRAVGSPASNRSVS